MNNKTSPSHDQYDPAEEQNQAFTSDVPTKKYTVREVLDSLSFSNLDHDDDEDGFLHITSSLNGKGIKIKKSEIR